MSRKTSKFFLVLFLLPLSSCLKDFENEPIKVSGQVGDKQIFACRLEEDPEEILRDHHTFDSLCDKISLNFVDAINQYPDIALTLEFINKNSAETFKTRFPDVGSKVKKLIWQNWLNFNYTQQDLEDVFKLLPNLDFLDLNAWTALDKDSSKFTLNNLKALKLRDADPSFFELIAEALPKNQISKLDINQIYTEDSLKKFFTAQELINDIKIEGKYVDLKPFESLKLKKLNFNFGTARNVTNEMRKSFKELLQSQLELEEIDMPTELYQQFVINDEVFDVLITLEHLKVLKINIDGISIEKFNKLFELRSLKTLELKTGRDSINKKLQSLSLIENQSLEDIAYDSYGLPDKTYQQFNANFKNLKSLTIFRGARRNLNYFMKTFPNLESLNVRFGDSNDQWKFKDVYEADGQTHLKMKRLTLVIWSSKVDVDKFIKLINSFPNLESLVITSVKFPFTNEALTQLLNNLGKIKHLELSSFNIACNEDFPEETIEILKQFKSKLDSGYLKFSNVVRHFPREDQCEKKDEGKSQRDFSYEPLIGPLKELYKVTTSSFSNIRTYKSLELVW